MTDKRIANGILKVLAASSVIWILVLLKSYVDVGFDVLPSLENELLNMILMPGVFFAVALKYGAVTPQSRLAVGVISCLLWAVVLLTLYACRRWEISKSRNRANSSHEVGPKL